MDEMLDRWRGWRFKNTALFMLGLVLFCLFTRTPQIDAALSHLGYYGRLGALIAGLFFVSTYTVVPAGYVLFELARYQSPLEVALFGGLGSVLGDYVIFRFVKDGVMTELRPLLAQLQTRRLRRLFHTPYFAWAGPVLGAIIIASPLPDELGIAMLGVGKMKSSHFLVMAYILNVLGILVIVSLGRAVGV